MAEQVLQDVLEWCFKNTNILEAKDNDKYGESLIHFASERCYGIGHLPSCYLVGVCYF